MLTGGQILVKALKAHNVETVFTVAGESYLPVLDALLDYPEIKVITHRQESGATFAAEAYAHMTGKVGVAMVTRGPGACNASIGVHTGKQSSAPMILFVGQINSADRGKEAFQEFDLPQMFDSHSKWAADIPRSSDVADYVTRAFHTALSGRMGPVVLGLPEEVLKEDAADQEIAPTPIQRTAPESSDIDAAITMLSAAQKPLVIVGGSGWRNDMCAALQDWAKAADLPVAASLRRQDIFDHTHESYIGDVGFGPNPALIARIKEADLVIGLGVRFNEIMTQEYALFPTDHQKIIHVQPCEQEFNKVYQTDLNIKSHPALFVEAMAARTIDSAAWGDWRAGSRALYEDWTAMPAARTSDWNGADMTQIFRHLRETLPANAIITGDAGNYSGWLHRYLRFGRPGHQLSPVSGAMGYGVPSALAAALTHPDRLVLGICGDGGFMMTNMELATAMHHGAKPIIMVCNNTMYGTIRMHQEKHFPDRVSATDLTNPDFVKLAESYGAFAARVTHEDDFPAIWEAAQKAGKAALIEIKMDPRQITTNAKL